MIVQENVELASRTTLRLGGKARFFVEAATEADVLEALGWARSRGLPLRVLGGGSNLVVADAGFEGLVLAPCLRGVRLEGAGERAELTAGAGEAWDSVVLRAVDSGLSGIECLSGIPGSTGATPIQNVGAYGQEVSETVVRVRAIDRERAEVRVFAKDECRFRYRDSWFKSGAPERFVVTEVTFQLTRRAPSRPRYPDLERVLGTSDELDVAEVRNAVLRVRAEKSMLADLADENGRSCGSFFLNPVVSREQFEALRRAVHPLQPPSYPQPDGTVKLPAAWLIEQAGNARGMRHGAAGLSTRHALAIVAHEGATAEAIVALARKLRRSVLDRFAVALSPEPNFWGFESADPVTSG